MIFSFDIKVMHVKHCLNSKQSPNRALPHPPQFFKYYIKWGGKYVIFTVKNGSS